MNGNIEFEALELRKSKIILFLKVLTGNISERDLLQYLLKSKALMIPQTSMCFQNLIKSTVATSNHPETDYKNKDWVFINYTYKRFEGLTARGAIPSYMKAAK